MIRDVIFHEHIFPFASIGDSATTQALDKGYATARNLVLETLGPCEESQGNISGMTQPSGESTLGPFSLLGQSKIMQ